MTERLRIDRLAARGDGVADTPAGAVYVPYTLPGETVSVEPVPGQHPDRRHLVAVDVPSPERIEPVCQHFGVCGGCVMQHWQTGKYREWKRGLLIAALEQARIEAPVEPLVDAHGEGAIPETLRFLRFRPSALVGLHQVLAKQPDRLGIGARRIRRQPQEPQEREPIPDLELRLIVRQIV